MSLKQTLLHSALAGALAFATANVASATEVSCGSAKVGPVTVGDDIAELGKTFPSLRGTRRTSKGLEPGFTTWKLSDDGRKFDLYVDPHGTVYFVRLVVEVPLTEVVSVKAQLCERYQLIAEPRGLSKTTVYLHDCESVEPFDPAVSETYFIGLMQGQTNGMECLIKAAIARNFVKKNSLSRLIINAGFSTEAYENGWADRQTSPAAMTTAKKEYF